MPCIQLITNKPLEIETQARIKACFGAAIELLPGKSENWLACIFHPACSIWFQGQQTDFAFLEVDLFGTLDREPCDALTQALMSAIASELHIPTNQIYIKYSATTVWGWNGKNF